MYLEKLLFILLKHASEIFVSTWPMEGGGDQAWYWFLHDETDDETEVHMRKSFQKILQEASQQRSQK